LEKRFRKIPLLALYFLETRTALSQIVWGRLGEIWPIQNKYLLVILEIFALEPVRSRDSNYRRSRHFLTPLPYDGKSHLPSTDAGAQGDK
jgi:hypothetical protein